MGIQRVTKPTTRKGKKFLINRAPKLIENTKQSIFINGRKTSETLNRCLRDLYHIKKPDALMLSGKHDLLPFEDTTPLETSARKFDSSMFFFGSHSKKRPNNVILGRMYDSTILDAVELGIDSFKGLDEFEAEKITTGLKPCLTFVGKNFDIDPEMIRIKNLLVDLFHREDVNSVRLQGIEHSLVFTAIDKNIFMRSYKILLKKSGSRIPRVELEEIGPAVDFSLRRTKLASDDLFKLACKQPSELKAKKVKNISRDSFGSKLGRVHIRQQDIKTLQTRKMKGLKKPRGEKKQRSEKPPGSGKKPRAGKKKKQADD